MARRKQSKPKKAARAKTTSRRTAAKRSKTKSDRPSLAGGRPMHTLTCQLVVDGAEKAIEWYTRAFGAKQVERNDGPGGKIMHAVVRIGDTPFFISDSFSPIPDESSRAYLHIEDKGIQTLWDKAIAAGATEILPLANQFWGQKYGQLRDPFGQFWSFGWPAKMTEAEKKKMREAAMAMMANPPTA